MGTPNFARPTNASKYYVVGADTEENYSECDCGRFAEWENEYTAEDFCTSCGNEVKHETESRAMECHEWEWLKENIVERLDELEGFSAGESHDNERNYGSTILGSLSKSKSWGEAEFTVTLKPMITSAYYEGATLDFKIEVTTYGDSFDYNEEGIESILDDGFDEYYIDLNRGLAAIFRTYAETWIEQTVTDLSEKLEKVFEEISSHKLTCKGVFSNGEAIYESVE